MFDLHEGLDSDDHVCSFNDPVNGDSVNTTKTTTDFKFWEDRIREGNEDPEEEDNDYTAYSPPLWSRNSVHENPLARLNHHSSYPSPTSQFKATTASVKKELPVEMAPNDVPELSYELSLRDIVSDEQSSNEAVRKDITKLREGKIVIAQMAIPKAKKNRKNLKRRQISRSESMDSGVFLLKMFLPTSLCSNKKPAAEKNMSNVVRSPSFDGFLKAVNTDWWKIKLLSDNKNSSQSSSSSSGSSRGSISSTQSCRDAENEINVKPGCCWSFTTRDCKPKRQTSSSWCLLF